MEKKLIVAVCWLAAMGAGAPLSAEEVTGEVVDLACYIGHGAKGDKHAKCAKACIEGGMPVGILTDDGKLYLVVGAQHKALNDQLAEHAAKKIKAQGKVSTQNGVSLLIADKFEPVK